jgi:hypothetical protein
MKLSNTSIHPHKSVDSNLVVHVKLEKMFRKWEHNGFKPKPNEHLTIANCDVFLKLYKIVYVHPLNNGQCFVIFLKG